jgi:FlaA1/EpsC-like NDP-sugar epimerase
MGFLIKPSIAGAMSKLVSPVLAMPRFIKRMVVVLLDCSLCILAVWFAFYLRLGEFVTLSGSALWASIIAIVIAIPLFVVSGMYRAIFRYSGWPVLLTVLKVTFLYGVIYAAIFTAIGFQGVPRTIGLIQPILLAIAVSASRALARFWLGGLYQRQFGLSTLPRVLIYGAGNRGRQLAAVLSNKQEMRVSGFLDDDPRLQGRVLNGLPIYNPSKLPQLVGSMNIKTVLLALPAIDRKRRNVIIENIRRVRVSLRTLPSLNDTTQGRTSAAGLQDLDIDDLLNREQVEPDYVLFAQNIKNKVVIVSGAGGSIGSELCRQIISAKPRILLLIEQNETALYEIHQELTQAALDHSIQIIPLLASVRDETRMIEIIVTWRPETLYHAAAYKHVPLVEHNPTEGIQNNVYGTLSIAKAAIRGKVRNFVLISTDKAVRPTNVMGASKRLAEMLLQALAAKGTDTIFSMVRFGNVLDSSGSVVPKFRAQIREGGPVTLTHPDVTRYFMTIPEAAQLVIQAGAMAEGGDVFVLDMGTSVKILDLAYRMIELSGRTVKDAFNPDGDIEIQIIGLRPGEKLFEELLIGNEPETTTHPRIMKAHEEFIAWEDLEPTIDKLEDLVKTHKVIELRQLLEKLNLGYVADENIVDWAYLEKTK